jgi:hypothetical protein
VIHHFGCIPVQTLPPPCHPPKEPPKRDVEVAVFF